MAITYTWNIDQLECSPQLDDKTDVVITVYWKLTAADGDHTATMYGSMSLNFEPDGNFTPYDQLTEAQVIGWVEAAQGETTVAQMKDALLKQIQEQQNPPIVRKPLPWIQPEPAVQEPVPTVPDAPAPIVETDLTNTTNADTTNNNNMTGTSVT